MNTSQQDPKTEHPQPPLPKQPQAFPGLEHKMEPRPDFGEVSYQGSGKLTGKAALITGGDSGIGRAVALAFAREGANVAISYLPEEKDDAQETVRAIEASGQRAVTLPGDVRDEAHCVQLVESTVKELGGIDILVNNAALQKHFDGVSEITSKDFEDIFRTNVFATFYLCKAAMPHMKPGSAIINTVSIEAYEPKGMLLPYSASKGAIVTMTKAMAEELIEKGIRINAVAPGPIWTPLNTHGSPADKLPEFGKSTLLGRPGQPAELAPVYVLLASNDGSYITGEIYGVTGGKSVA